MKNCEPCRLLKRGALACAMVLVLAACATSMQMPSEELKRVAPDEGIVVGSLQIKGGKDILGRSTWELMARRIKDSRMANLASPGFEYAIQASRDGEEELFVTKMPAGVYAFWKLYQPGFSNFTQRTDVYFKVHPAAVTYIGKLVIEFPPGLISSSPPDPFTGRTGLKFQLKVEDAKAPTLDRARQKYGVGADAVITDLMTITAPN